MNLLALALLSIGLSVAAQFLLKAGMAGNAVRDALAGPLSLRLAGALATDWRILAGFALYGVGALAWLGVLARWDVSKAYPLVGLGFVATLAVGFLQGEQVTLARIAGVLLICAGVFVIARS